MDVKNISRIDGLVPNQDRGSAQLDKIGPSFKDTFNSISRPSLDSNQAVGSAERLRFSNHAIERMRSRGIQMNPEDLMRLEQAVSKADKKGSKDSLVLMGDSAFVVSVKNKTVVTVMDRTMMKDNVFTNIDSTIVM